MKKSKVWFRTQPFRFLKLPKDLYENPVYSSLSDTAMMLYALLLDRANLSAENGPDWIDPDGNLFLYYTIADAASALHCSRDKAAGAMQELVDAFLIYRYQVGLCRAYRIIVLPFEPKQEFPVLESSGTGISNAADSAANKTEHSQTEGMQKIL